MITGYERVITVRLGASGSQDHNERAEQRSSDVLYQLEPEVMRAIEKYVCQWRLRHSNVKRCLFPTLATLTVTPTESEWFPAYLAFLCGDTLRSLTLTFGRRGGGSVTLMRDLWKALPTLLPHWPHLRYLDLPNLSHNVQEIAADPDNIEGINGSLKDLRGLQRFHAEMALRPSLFQTLAELPDLRLLSVTGVPYDVSRWELPPSSTTTDYFVALEVLSLHVHYPTCTSSLLQLLAGSTSLNSLSLTYSCGEDISESTIDERIKATFNAISQIPTIRTLYLSYNANIGTLAIPTLSGALLAMLHALKHMRSIILSGFACYMLEDEDFVDTAAAWPHLETIMFHMNDRPSLNLVPVAPRNSLAGIQALYNGCPNLQSVSLFANTTVPRASDGFGLPILHSREVPLHSLSLGFPVDETEVGKIRMTEIVPLLIRLLLPRVESLSMHCGRLMVWGKWESYKDLDSIQVRTKLEEKLAVLEVLALYYESP